MLGTNQTLLKPPVHAVVSDDNGLISPTWRTFFANLEPFLQRINQFGFQVSPMTTTIRDKITPTPGQQIFNTTLGKGQIWNGTAWETIISA